jgi:hypothetical protein
LQEKKGNEKMTDNQTGNQAVGGEVGSPTQPASPASPQAISELDAEALRKALKPLIEEEVSRRTQSDKDKRIGKLESKVTDFESQLARFTQLKEELGNEKLAHLYMKMEDQGLNPAAEVVEANASQNRTTQAGTPTETEKLTQALIGQLGLSANDPEVTEGLRIDDFTTQASYYLTLADKRKKAQDAPANPAQTMPTGGGSAINTADKETIAAELLRLSMEPSKNYAKIQELNAKLKTIS